MMKSGATNPTTIIAAATARHFNGSRCHSLLKFTDRPEELLMTMKPRIEPLVTAREVFTQIHAKSAPTLFNPSTLHLFNPSLGSVAHLHFFVAWTFAHRAFAAAEILARAAADIFLCRRIVPPTVIGSGIPKMPVSSRSKFSMRSLIAVAFFSSAAVKSLSLLIMIRDSSAA